MYISFHIIRCVPQSSTAIEFSSRFWFQGNGFGSYLIFQELFFFQSSNYLKRILKTIYLPIHGYLLWWQQVRLKACSDLKGKAYKAIHVVYKMNGNDATKDCTQNASHSFFSCVLWNALKNHLVKPSGFLVFERAFILKYFPCPNILHVVQLNNTCSISCLWLLVCGKGRLPSFINERP